MKPYLIIPRLIEQPTWGGNYIAELKNWTNLSQLQGKKIGQSYELTGNSTLSTGITDTTHPEFLPEFEHPITYGDVMSLSALVEQNSAGILGEKVHNQIGKMPLLIKLNQAAGNSFQLHVKPGTHHIRWQPKPESWYFLEPGYISCGIKPGISIGKYKQACVQINDKMIQLSSEVKNTTKTLAQAREEAHAYIQEINPWQYVNRYEMQKYDLLDLSEGAVHHSWEENKEKFPLGNIVYEVQMDVMDPYCTIRSFDQGKMKEDGSIREIHIDDYFQFLDSDPTHNNIDYLRRTAQDSNLLHTPYYSLDILEIHSVRPVSTGSSFNHLYVRDGDIEVQTRDGMVRLTRGHSCFVPQNVGQYQIKTNVEQSVVLKTYISL